MDICALYFLIESNFSKIEHGDSQLVSHALVTAQQDQTLKAGTFGSAVVETTINIIGSSCIFDDDKLFLRRLAYVESSDGISSTAYRKGYHGGIWQVDQSMFNQLQRSSAKSILSKNIQTLKVKLGVDFNKLDWLDLRKPLLSAIAARLYIELKSQDDSDGIPRSIEDQAIFWKNFYRTKGSTTEFKKKSLTLEKGCSNVRGLDLMFVIDGSGSIGTKNFKTIKKFVKNVINAFDVGSSKTRIGVVKYSTKVTIEFPLNRYKDKKSLFAAVDRIKYIGGGTYTHMALDGMRGVMVQEKFGARPKEEGYPHVAVVLTDGRSKRPPLTIMSALKAHEQDITMFAIGVGSKLDLIELKAIASKPVCQHLFLLKGFKEMEALKSAIEKKTCNAPIIIGPGSEISKPLPPETDVQCKIKVPAKGATIKVIAWTGSVSFYTSRISFPNGAFYEKSITSSLVIRSSMFLSQPKTEDEYALIYCNIHTGTEDINNITITWHPGDQDWCRLSPCKNGGKCSEEEDGFTCACLEGFNGKQCQDRIDHCDPNPCIHGRCVNLPSGFECKCDLGFEGRVCETEMDHCVGSPCRHGGICQNERTHFTCNCSIGYSGVHCEERDHCDPNPCKNLGKCVSETSGFSCVCPEGYTANDCSDRVYCDPSPCQNGGECKPDIDGYICTCSSGYTGLHCQVTQTESSGFNCGDNNPCTSANISKKKFYHAYDGSRHKFVQCSEWGQCYVMPCAAGTRWDQVAYTCVHDN